MINKHFMLGISDVLANDEQLCHSFKADKVSITHVAVGQHFNHVNIFWTTGEIDFQRVEVKLNSLIPLLTNKLIERNFMSNLPVIRFCFDRNKVNEEMLESAFKKLSVRSDPTGFVPPTKEATGYKLNNPYGPKQWSKRLVRFDAEFKEEQTARQENLLAMKMNYTYTKFTAPPDMALNYGGLDYEKFINQVNEKLRKVRSGGIDHSGDALPPAHWVDQPNLLPPPDGTDARDPKQTTEYRLQAMKNFVIGNRKKKRFSHKMEERAIEQHNQLISEHLEEARMRLQTKDSEVFDDVITENEEGENALWAEDDLQSRDDQ